MLVRKLSVGGLAAVAVLSGGAAQAAVVLTTPVYFQNFDTLANTGTSSVLPGGFEILERGTAANTLYTAGTGSGTTGDTYSFGASGSTDRALGGLQSNALNPLFGIQFTNLLGRTISAFNISFVGEQYRLGAQNRVDRLAFEYSLNATGLNTGTFIPLTALDFVAPTTRGTVGALDGNASANQRAISGTIAGLELLQGQRQPVSSVRRFVVAGSRASQYSLDLSQGLLSKPLRPAKAELPSSSSPTMPASWSALAAFAARGNGSSASISV